MAAPAPADLATAQLAFLGAHALVVSTWNAQGLFGHALSPAKQRAKLQTLEVLLARGQLVAVQECHGSDADMDALRTAQRHHEFFTSFHEQGAAKGGICIAVCKKLKSSFSAANFKVIEAGRVAVLHLSGPRGAISFACVRMTPNTKALAANATAAALARAIPPFPKALGIVCGD